MATIPKVIKNFNVTVDGVGYAGRAESVKLPELKIKTEEHRTGGMDIPVDLDMGMEKLELQFTLSEHAASVFRQFGIFSGNGVALQFRAAKSDDFTVEPYVINCSGMYTVQNPGTIKVGDKTPFEATLNLRVYQLLLNGTELVYIDAENMIRRINGVDVLAQQRAALGL
jgi:P2 family phage contractile tail tube protein